MDKRYETITEVRKFNPFHDARGRFATANSYSSFTYKPGKSKAHDLAIQRMQQRQQASASTKKPAAAAHSPSNPKPKPAKPKVNRDRLGFADHDDADYHDLHSGRKYYQQQKFTAKQKQSADNYLENHQEPGSLYSHAQNMNWKMANGQPLTGKYKQTHDGMMSAMHNIGYNVKLQRYDHPDMVNNILKSSGAGSNYENMSEASLKKALVGKPLGENKFISTSYNDFKNAANADTFTTRGIKINYLVKANTQAVMPGVGPGGDFGEVVLAPTNGTANKAGKIVDVRFTGEMARRRGTPVWDKNNYDLPRLEIDVEIG